MKLQRNLPTNGDFFDRYAELITSLSSVATIAQIITGACEIGILYGYIGVISMIGAVICAALLQIGLKKVYPHAVRAILHKHFKGLYLWFSIFIFILTLAMLTASITLSWQGSKDIADFAVSKPIEKTMLRSDSTKNADFLTAQRLFTSDSATIETKYKGKLEAIESDKMNEINVVERNAKGKQATSLRAELKTKLAKLQADKAAEIETKANDRKKSMDRATDRNDGDAATIATDNTTSKNEVATKKSRYKGYIGYFTLMCYVFFLSVFTMNEIYHKGANIEIKPLPSQRHFNPSVFAEFIETVKEKLDVFFRTKIQDWADKTPPQPLPLSMSALYDFKADVFTDTIKIETTGKETKVVKLPLKVHKIAAIGKEDNQATQRQIGFRKDDNTKGDTAEKEAVRNAYNATNMSISNTTKYTILNCAFEPCGQPFERRTTFQKYCCEEHRIAAFESRTGRQLKKQAKK
jgi:phage anti-repressor protein